MHLDAHYTDYSTARAVITPVPFDGTTCYRPGTREGPQAIISASRNLELYDAELRRSPYTVGIHTLRPVEIINGDAEAMVNRIEQVTGHLLDAGKFVVTLGGDHLTSIGVIRAFAQRHTGMSVLQLEAHAGGLYAHRAGRHPQPERARGAAGGGAQAAALAGQRHPCAEHAWPPRLD